MSLLYPDQWPAWAEDWNAGVWGVLCEDDEDRRYEHDLHELGTRTAHYIEAENPPYPG